MRWARPGWESTAKPWRIWLGSVLACATMTAAGCGSAPAAPTRAPVTLPDLSTLRTFQPAEWSVPIDVPTTFSIAPDASAVAGASAAEGGGAAIPWGFTRFGATVPLDGLADGAVFALSGQMIVVGPGVADQTGPVTLVTPSGQSWSTNAIGPIFATSSLSGSRVAIIDSGNASLRVLHVHPDGSASPVPLSGLRDLGSGASAQFDGLGDVLVADAQQAALFGPAGVTEWSVPLHASALPRSFVLDGDGGGVTAATSGNDNTLYQFAAPGSRPTVAWSEPLAAGGGNRLVAGPDGHVAIGSVGNSATLAVYRTQDGALQWQDTLPAPSNGPTPALGTLAFGPHDGVVATITGCDAAGDSCLMLFGADGTPLGLVNLAAGGQVALAANGEAAAVVVSSGGQATLTWLDLSGLWQDSASSSSTLSS